MKITRDNYESYFIDYLEGNLDEKLVNDFIEFLQENPGLKEELQLAGSFKLEAAPTVYKGKEKLYKSKYDQKDVFDNVAVAWLEGDLATEEKTDFEAYLSLHPEKQNDLKLFEKTRLRADEQIVFPEKSRLLKRNKGRTVLLWVTRIAAVLVISLLVYKYAGNVAVNHPVYEQQVIVSENKKEKPLPAQLPGKVEKEQDPIPVKENTATPVKKTETKSQPAKSLRESNKGRIDHEKVAQLRDPLYIPGEIPSLNASLHSFDREVASLIPVTKQVDEMPLPEDDERFLADVMLEKTGLDNLSLKRLPWPDLTLFPMFQKKNLTTKQTPMGR
jgi:hypothetical protein